ncbi:putative phospholipase carboxylesterase [Rosellinia necatrix]|uniref:Putative phospholipase carboxylesterase n=1 Tax=Rosellinia necatrix TaxID=77044 RepID=A0A1W2TQ91_ROSNE|nr:putative phospholipase carboxylesterase [Rosellinia necatrix]
MVLFNVSLPAHNQHTHTIIFLHGHESSARDLSQLIWESHDRRGWSLQHIFPSVKWVFPQAEEVYVERFQQYLSRWYDIWDARDPDDRRDLQVPGLRNATPQLISLIKSEASRVGLANVILAGVSQGCATAVHALLNYPISETAEEGNRLCAFIGLSGWMSLQAGSAQESRQLLGAVSTPNDNIYLNTPAFLSHCADDTAVPIIQGERLRHTLTTYGMTVTWKPYLSGGQWINTPQGVEDLVAFLKTQGLASM